jgi:hypothetical protein
LPARRRSTNMTGLSWTAPEVNSSRRRRCRRRTCRCSVWSGPWPACCGSGRGWRPVEDVICNTNAL